MRLKPIELLLLLMIGLFVGGCDYSPLFPPVPQPQPDVPPIVDPQPVPISSTLRVLIVEEGQRRDRLLPDQVEIFTSAPFRAWLAERNAELRVWDQDVDASRDSAEFRAMLAMKRESLPWLVVVGKRQFSGPLPQTLAETQAVIERANQ